MRKLQVVVSGLMVSLVAGFAPANQAADGPALKVTDVFYDTTTNPPVIQVRVSSPVLPQTLTTESVSVSTIDLTGTGPWVQSTIIGISQGLPAPATIYIQTLNPVFSGTTIRVILKGNGPAPIMGQNHKLLENGGEFVDMHPL